jgi:hypothetical protein
MRASFLSFFKDSIKDQMPDGCDSVASDSINHSVDFADQMAPGTWVRWIRDSRRDFRQLELFR